MAADLSAAPTTAGTAGYFSNQNRSNEEKENSTNKDNKTNGNGGGGGGGTQMMVGGTRVFKKTSPSGYITCYLGKRDFIDHLSHCDPIDGVVLVDPDRIGSDKVFVHVLAAFRYGREDLDVLGLTFRKDLFLNNVQVYPPVPENRRPISKLQERLMKKLGPNAYPFYFELPHSSPASVTLQPAQNDTGKPCGVDYELKAYAAASADERPHKRNAIRLAIRKLIYAPPDAGPQPSAEQVKELTFPHSGVVRLEATLDRQKYYHGEPISINVLVDNNTSKPIKRYKVSIRQYADICLFSTAQYVCPVASLEGEDFIAANQSGWCKVYTLQPILSANRDKRGLALDGKLKHEETNLASSTILDNVVSKDNLGIIVSYKVKVKLYLAFGAGDIAVELPFILTHPLPANSSGGGHHHSATNNHTNNAGSRNSATNNNFSAPKTTQQGQRPGSMSLCENGPDMIGVSGGQQQQQPPSVMGTSLPVADHNLIQLDDDPDPVSVHLDDDVIFEDFARMRLQAHAARTTNGNTTTTTTTVQVAPAAPALPQQPPQLPLLPTPLFAIPNQTATVMTAPSSLAALQQRQIMSGLGIEPTPPTTNVFPANNPFSGLPMPPSFNQQQQQQQPQLPFGIPVAPVVVPPPPVAAAATVSAATNNNNNNNNLTATSQPFGESRA